MKNIINIILLQFSVFAFGNAQPNIDMSNYTVSNNETFTATVNVKPNGLSISVVEFSILYDNSLIQIEETEVGDGLSGYYNINNPGIILFSAIHSEGLENDFTAMSITFKVIDAAMLTSNIEIIIEQLTDSYGNILDHNKTNGLLNLNQANCTDYLFVGISENSSEMITEGIYQAAEHIESNGIIEAKKSEVIFKAGKKIDLLPGFEVQKPASFSIKLEGCLAD